MRPCVALVRFRPGFRYVVEILQQYESFPRLWACCCWLPYEVVNVRISIDDKGSTMPLVSWPVLLFLLGLLLFLLRPGLCVLSVEYCQSMNFNHRHRRPDLVLSRSRH